MKMSFKLIIVGPSLVLLLACCLLVVCADKTVQPAKQAAEDKAPIAEPAKQQESNFVSANLGQRGTKKSNAGTPSRPANALASEAATISLGPFGQFKMSPKRADDFESLVQMIVQMVLKVFDANSRSGKFQFPFINRLPYALGKSKAATSGGKAQPSGSNQAKPGKPTQTPKEPQQEKEKQQQQQQQQNDASEAQKSSNAQTNSAQKHGQQPKGGEDKGESSGSLTIGGGGDSSSAQAGKQQKLNKDPKATQSSKQEARAEQSNSGDQSPVEQIIQQLDVDKLRELVLGAVKIV